MAFNGNKKLKVGTSMLTINVGTVRDQEVYEIKHTECSPRSQ